MQPYGRKPGHPTLHDTDRCGICAELNGPSAAKARSEWRRRLIEDLPESDPDEDAQASAIEARYAARRWATSTG